MKSKISVIENTFMNRDPKFKIGDKVRVVIETYENMENVVRTFDGWIFSINTGYWCQSLYEYGIGKDKAATTIHLTVPEDKIEPLNN